MRLMSVIFMLLAYFSPWGMVEAGTG